jgi:DDE superfamily endonuclease/Winged helix-turn helix
MFAEAMSAREIAAVLEVSTKSAYPWRRAWAAGGEQALHSNGAPGPARVLSEAQVQKRVAKLHEGPAAPGWVEDHRWTLARVCTLIGRMFPHHGRGQHRLGGLAPGWVHPAAADRPGRRTRRTGHRALPPAPVARGKRVARRLGAWVCFADESGLSLRPARARTWAPRGKTPIVRVAGRGGRKISVAGRTAYRGGHRPRLIYRIMLHQGRKAEPKGFGEDHFATLLDAAYQQLGGPILLVWDGLPAHKSAKMRALIAGRRWLRVYQLPGYAPELNPAQNVWSNLKRAMANLAPGHRR